MSGVELPALVASERGVQRGTMRVPDTWPWADVSSHMFVLGAKEHGQSATLTALDYVFVGRKFYFANHALLRFKVRLRGSWQTADTWALQAYVGPYLYSDRVLVPQRSLDAWDLACNVSMLSGEQSVLFALRLRETATGEVDVPSVSLDLIEHVGFIDAMQDPHVDNLLTVINRAPEPNETRVPASSTLRIEFATTTPNPAAATIQAAAVTVSVAGTVAFVNGAAANGFTAEWVPEARPWVARLTLTPPTALTPGATLAVVVDVAANAVHDTVANTYSTAIHETYSFTVDSPFIVTSATMRAPRAVLVRFSRAYYSTDQTALSPDQYSVTQAVIEDTPRTALPNVATVDAVLDYLGRRDPYSVLVTTATELPAKRPTLLQSSGIRDSDGVPLTSMEVPLVMLAQSVAGRSFDLFEMMPRRNRLDDTTGDLRHLLWPKQEVVDLLLAIIDDFSRQFDVNTADRGFVDLVLAEHGSPFTFTMSDRAAARLALELVNMLRAKGTTIGIEDALNYLLGIPSLNPRVWNYTRASGRLGIDFNLHHDRLGGGTLRDRLGFYVTVDVNLNWVGTAPGTGLPLYDATVGATRRAMVPAICNALKWGPTYLKRLFEPALPAEPDPLNDGDRFDQCPIPVLPEP